MKKEKRITQGTIMKAMDWAYNKAVTGAVGLDSAEKLALDYMKGEGTLRDKANSLIRWQNTKAGTSGFITGLGGLLSLPVSLPVNITSVLFVQIRMIAAIARMGGYDLNDDRVRTLVYACLTGNAVTEAVKQAGIKIGEEVASNLIQKLSAETLKKVNEKVGFKLFTKFGEKGIINFSKAIPLLGGIIGATFDVVSTNTIGNVARDTFIPKNGTSPILTPTETVQKEAEETIEEAQAVEYEEIKDPEQE